MNLNLDFKILGIKAKYLLIVSMCINVFLILFVINEWVAFGILAYCAFVYIIAGIIELIKDDVL
jgi:hypothetical protein